MQRAATWLRLIPLGFAVLLMGAGRWRAAAAGAGGQRTATGTRCARCSRKGRTSMPPRRTARRRCIGRRYHDDAESADLLIRAGADVNAANDLGVTPLWAASQNGNASPWCEGCSTPGPIRTLRCCAGETPLMVAARCRLSRSRGTVARPRRERERARGPRPDGADVGGVAEASRCREGAARARRRRSGSFRSLERGDGRAAPWLSAATTR